MEFYGSQDLLVGLPITLNYMLLMGKTVKIIHNFPFLYFKKNFINCSLCTAKDKKI